MKKIALGALLGAAVLSGCSTYTVPNYGISADSNMSIKALQLSQTVSVGSFSSSAKIDTNCRAVGPISLPNNLTVVSYVKKALEDELKVAGAYSTGNAKYVLSGEITNFGMSSSKNMTRGYWDLTLRLSSSNGQAMTASEYYEFESGFGGETACSNTANAFMPTVQNLIRKAVTAPEFKRLVSN